MKKFVLYVEGKGDLKFMTGLIEKRFSCRLDLDGNGKIGFFSNGSQMIELGAFNEIVNRISDIKDFINDGFSILVVADCDKGKEEKKKYYNGIKEKNEIDFDLHLVGDETGRGAIERLMEASIKDEFKPLSNCFKQFNECLKSENKKYIDYVAPHPFNSIKTYFDKFVELAKKKGKEPDIFDFEHNSLDDLYHFLSKYLIES